MMNISNEAVAALKKFLENEPGNQAAIRFFSVPGCCGPSIQMALSDENVETDERLVFDGIEFRIDQEVAGALQNATLVATERGFKIEGFESSQCC
jgi:Fe-S cluster assembly iron-binding protein IscA